MEIFYTLDEHNNLHVEQDQDIVTFEIRRPQDDHHTRKHNRKGVHHVLEQLQHCGLASSMWHHNNISTVGGCISSSPSNNVQGLHTLSSREPGSTNGFPCVELKDGNNKTKHWIACLGEINVLFDRRSNVNLYCLHGWRRHKDINNGCWSNGAWGINSTTSDSATVCWWACTSPQAQCTPTTKCSAVSPCSKPTRTALLVPLGGCGSGPLLTVWDPRFSSGHRQHSTHAWSLLECAAPGRSSQCGTRGFPGPTCQPATQCC